MGWCSVRFCSAALALLLAPVGTLGLHLSLHHPPRLPAARPLPNQQRCQQVRASSGSLQKHGRAHVGETDGGAADRDFGVRELFAYLWPTTGAVGAKLRIVGALALLLIAKLFVVRVPFIFKRCIDLLSTPATTSAFTAAGWMLAYGFARAIYTLLQEARYLTFTPVGQAALRRFMRDAFEHVQMLDAGWLSAQSTGELSRIFARGVRAMNTLLRLVVFNVVPTALEAALVVGLLAHRYGWQLMVSTTLCVGAFTAWSIFVVGRRVKLLSALNDNDNLIFTRFFNSLLNNEAVCPHARASNPQAAPRRACPLCSARLVSLLSLITPGLADHSGHAGPLVQQ